MIYRLPTTQKQIDTKVVSFAYKGGSDLLKPFYMKMQLMNYEITYFKSSEFNRVEQFWGKLHIKCLQFNLFVI